MSQTIRILFLYPNEMNIYGDTGNILTLTKRLEWRGFSPEVVYHHPGKPLDRNVHVIVGGGGQDSGQLKVCDDLKRIGPDLRELAASGVPMLMICGMYQLFGHRFVTHDDQELPGIGVFDMETRATPQRLIGTIVVQTKFGEVVGYENHSGQTFLADGQQPFGTVKRGYGNNASRGVEGAISHNVYGSYMHGSLLPKNPSFADELLRLAVQQATGSPEPSDLKPLDDELAAEARKVASRR